MHQLHGNAWNEGRRSHNVQVGGPRPPLHRKSNEALSVITRGQGYQLLTAAACTAVRTLSETTELCFELAAVGIQAAALLGSNVSTCCK